MLNPDSFAYHRHSRAYSGASRTRAQNSRTEGPIIDQDGRELPPELLRQARFKDAGFDAREARFQDGPFQGASFQTFGDAAFGDAAFGSAPLSREQRLARLDALARLLDSAFVIPGTNVRYGLDGLIGLVPVVGDVITTAISLWIVREARELGAPWHVTARMVGNVALDGTIGLVPVLGDAFDVVFRANLRNLRLLRRWIDRQR